MARHHMFTFGPDHAPIPNGVVYVSGCDDEQARGIMLALYGTKWSSQYDGDEEIFAYKAKYPTVTAKVVLVRNSAFPMAAPSGKD